tara:strand:+ start:651 stop:863 length:213 start_codon:yes stop_codon:yes gene_type:complete
MEKITPSTDPFNNFDPNKAEKLLNLAEEICKDEQTAALHFAVCLMGLAPNLESAQLLCKNVDIQAKKSEN